MPMSKAGANMEKSESDTLRRELSGLFRYVQRVRQEIAAIGRPAEEEHQFETMGEQLDAIVKATEEATNTIMTKMEENIELLAALRRRVDDPEAAAIIDKLSENGTAASEACSFQDMTGQRVTKVAKSITYVEDRVNKLIEVWGRAELDKVEVKPEREKTEDEKLLHGPALEGQGGLSQDEIDKLFG